MLLADKKKQENISEYIIYMYQTELLIRNFDFDPEKIKTHVLGNIPDEKMDMGKKEEALNWYKSLIEAMQSEGLEKEGHLASVQAEVDKLSELSLQLLAENEDYQAVFNAARPAIRANIQASEGLVTNPVQACLNGVFGLLIARMNGKEVTEEIQQQIEHFGNVLSMLSHSYRLTENS
ncbi:DUF4924 family protein [Roseivirga pacifica]|uniref:DUF4924 family protein n=1 Tax=Roseivirga pacifica TaxID=1267423 RepID=UPI00227A68AE|nr:DUF4924 family protein [Roseivirga pacifica]